MKIVFLDGGSLGDYMDLSPLSDKYELQVFPQTNADNVKERIKNAEVVITNKVPISREVLEEAKHLKFINVAATGYNNIDVEAASEYGVKVANVKRYSTEAVAQLVMTYMLAWASSLLDYQKDIRDGKWGDFPHFAMISQPVFELQGKKLGILGYGSIGKRVGELASAFGMEVMAGARPGAAYNDPKRVPLDSLLQTADVLTIHTPLTDKTRDMITARELQQMKQGALLINAARGGIVNEKDLFDILASGRIKAAVDVLSEEPPVNGNILLDAPNLIITPHIGWASYESRQRLLKGLLDNITYYEKGKADQISIN